MNFVIGYGIYIVGALALALLAVGGFASALDIGTRVRKEPLPYAFFAIVLAIMASPLATQRVLSAGLSSADASLEDIGSSFWLSRVLTVLVLVLCVERIARFFLHKQRQPLSAMWLWWAFFAFALAAQVLNGAFGAKPSFDHKGLYAFPAYFAFFLVAQRQPDRIFRFARWALLMFLVGSALAIGARPSTVLESGYAGWLPGISFRYYGLATHANTMGPLVIAFMILLWRYPFSVRWCNLLAWALAAGSLVLSQSKTSIVIGAGIWLFLWVYRLRAGIVRRDSLGAVKFSLLLWGVTCIALAGLTLGVLAGFNYIDWALGKFDTVTTGQWATLSGRTRIWALAWHEFLSHPVFGYGPTIWDPMYRFYAQLPFASHAHNQLMQSLSSAGAVGGVTFLVYALTLAVFALRASARSDGMSVALVGLLLIRSVSEVPFSTASIMQGEFIVQLLAMCACVAFARETGTAKSPALRRTTTESALSVKGAMA